MKRNDNSGGTVVRAVMLAVFLIAATILALQIAHRAFSEPPEPSALPEETPVETPASGPDAAERLLSGMTTREKICQLLIVQPEFLLKGNTPVTEMDDTLADAMQTYPVGGMLLTLQNMNDPEQLKALTGALQDSSGIPMILCLDEEGGEVGRLMYKVGTTRLDSMYTYRSQGTPTARANAATLGRDLAAFGFNTDLAPVADVWSNPENEVIGERAYSDDFDEAATLVSAAVHGFHDSGTICCLKHFPGHGSTRTDSHKEAAFVNATSDALRVHELLPFVYGIKAGADMVMVGHLTVPALDTVPATFSGKIVNGLLRSELGFDGVVITDGIEMKAAGTEPDGVKALRALNAGCDLLLGPYDIPGTVKALEQAVDDGTLTMDELDAHVLRVLRLKLRYDLFPEAPAAD